MPDYGYQQPAAEAPLLTHTAPVVTTSFLRPIQVQVDVGSSSSLSQHAALNPQSHEVRSAPTSNSQDTALHLQTLSQLYPSLTHRNGTITASTSASSLYPDFGSVQSLESSSSSGQPCDLSTHLLMGAPSQDCSHLVQVLERICSMSYHAISGAVSSHSQDQTQQSFKQRYPQIKNYLRHILTTIMSDAIWSDSFCWESLLRHRFRAMIPFAHAVVTPFIQSLQDKQVLLVVCG
jgi:hypothetical protein